MVIDNKNSTTNDFPTGPIQDNEKSVRAEITHLLQRYFKDVFTRIGCFDATFPYSLNQIANHTMCPHDMWPMPWQKPFKKELE